MCGIGGTLSLSFGHSSDSLEYAVRALADAQTHRGPDDVGYWVDSKAGIAFSHRRLSIIGLNPSGRQPMLSKSGRYVITYNGEIYNYRELRKSLEDGGVAFRTQTDTEVLLEAIDTWGITQALRLLNGMFALAVWDRTEQRLFLARDPFGIKPLCVGFSGDSVVFASEISAISRVLPSLTVDRNALKDFFQFGFVSSPRCIFEGCSKVPPGTILCLSSRNKDFPEDFSKAPTSFQNPKILSASIHTYISYTQELATGVSTTSSMTEDEATEELDSILKRAVKRQSVTDVPLGAFLSGGVDSSSLVAMMCASSSAPVRTFTIGFENARLDESEYARKIAAHLKTDHRELRVSDSEALSAAMRVGRIYDEPFADSSQIPTLLVSQMASREVKVVLTGDGGDEIFGGYNRHIHGASLWQRIQSLPPGAREALSNLAGLPHWKSVDRFAEGLISLVTPALKYRSFENVREKIGKVARADSIAELYISLISNMASPENYLAIDAPGEMRRAQVIPNLDDPRKLMFLDAVGYLQDDILTKVDRASMSCSLEARVPLLDLEVVRFAAKLPTNYLIKANSGKHLLKRVLRRYLPDELIERPKMGFAVPLTEWLQGPLKDWSIDSINAAESRFTDFVNWPTIKTELKNFHSGKGSNSSLVWSFVMFAEWSNSQSLS